MAKGGQNDIVWKPLNSFYDSLKKHGGVYNSLSFFLPFKFLRCFEIWPAKFKYFPDLKTYFSGFKAIALISMLSLICVSVSISALIVSNYSSICEAAPL